MKKVNYWYMLRCNILYYHFAYLHAYFCMMSCGSLHQIHMFPAEPLRQLLCSSRSTCIDPVVKRSKVKVTRLRKPSRLIVTHAATAVCHCCHCQRGSACRYGCLSFLVTYCVHCSSHKCVLFPRFTFVWVIKLLTYCSVCVTVVYTRICYVVILLLGCTAAIASDSGVLLHTE